MPRAFNTVATLVIFCSSDGLTQHIIPSLALTFTKAYQYVRYDRRTYALESLMESSSLLTPVRLAALPVLLQVNVVARQRINGWMSFRSDDILILIFALLPATRDGVL